MFLCGFPFLFVSVKCLIAVQACPRFPAEFFRLHVRRLFERVSKMRRVEKSAFLSYERYRFVCGRKHIRRVRYPYFFEIFNRRSVENLFEISEKVRRGHVYYSGQVVHRYFREIILFHILRCL